MFITWIASLPLAKTVVRCLCEERRATEWRGNPGLGDYVDCFLTGTVQVVTILPSVRIAGNLLRSSKCSLLTCDSPVCHACACRAGRQRQWGRYGLPPAELHSRLKTLTKASGYYDNNNEIISVICVHANLFWYVYSQGIENGVSHHFCISRFPYFIFLGITNMIFTFSPPTS